MSTTPIPPLVKQVVVPWTPEAAFRRFTAEIASWWPLRTHSIGQADGLEVVFEGRVGGTIHEVDRDGTRHVWETVRCRCIRGAGGPWS